MRSDGRVADALRDITIQSGYLDHAEGSVLITCGQTRVLCAASVEETVPGWLAGRGSGWVTGEYGMLPRATHTRRSRETKGLSGRTQEIRRLIGRSLRAAVNLNALGERMIVIDCDVIQADGGTRTASVTGGYVALALALRGLIADGVIDAHVYGPAVAAVSVGIVEGQPMLDLCYREDAAAEVDFNVVMDEHGEYIEVQGTAEGQPFSRRELDGLLDLAGSGIERLLALQQDALKNA